MLRRDHRIGRCCAQHIEGWSVKRVDLTGSIRCPEYSFGRYWLDPTGYERHDLTPNNGDFTGSGRRVRPGLLLGLCRRGSPGKGGGGGCALRFLSAGTIRRPRRGRRRAVCERWRRCVPGRRWTTAPAAGRSRRWTAPVRAVLAPPIRGWSAVVRLVRCRRGAASAVLAHGSAPARARLAFVASPPRQSK